MSFPRYPKYKPSGAEWLGDVPEHWVVKRLKHISSSISVGIVVNPSTFVAKEGYPFIYGGDIREGVIDWTNARRIDAESSEANAKTRLNAGDLLTVRVGAPGVTAVVPAECEGGNCASVMLIRQGEFNSHWLCYAMNTPIVRFQVEVVQYGAAQEQFNISHAVNFCTPTPPRDEQTKIASFLDRETAKIDGLVGEQRRLIELLKEKRQAVISHAVTKGLNPHAPLKPSGIEWLGDVPEHWAVGGLTRFIGPVVDYRGRTPTKMDEGVFLVTARNVRDGKIDYEASEEFVDPDSAASLLARGMPEIGDLLFTMEAPLGQVALIDRTDIALAQRIVKFRGTPDVMRNSFLLYWFMGSCCQARLETLATGSTALGIKSSKLGMIECLVPPVDEQTAIAIYIDRETAKLDALTAEAERAIVLLQERRTALISAAVTGKIDVRGLVETEAA